MFLESDYRKLEIHMDNYRVNQNLGDYFRVANYSGVFCGTS
jgi:hypothetical protein